MDNYKPGCENIDDIDDNMDLHERAGLIAQGRDEDGDMQWLGNQKQWNKFRELEFDEENEDKDFDTDARLVGDISDDNREGVIL